jgi:cytochrome c553
MRIALLFGVLSLGVAFVAGAQDTAPAAAPAETVAPSADAAPAGEAVPAVAAADAPAHAGDAAAGETKAAACGACHGLDGNSADPQYPKLAGQHENYIARHLDLFKSGARENPIMLGFAATLSAQDMRDLGAFYAAKPAVAGMANDALVAEGAEETWAQRGARLYRGGNPAAGVPACMACHGPSGAGNPGPAYPALAGQHADYTKAQLLRYRAGQFHGKVESGTANLVMVDAARGLSDTDVEALATFIEGLHQAPTQQAP